MKIYMAGPLFSTAECKFNEVMAQQLRLHGHEVFLPQENEQGSNPTLIFRSDKDGIDWCDLVLANLDGPDPDSGTCWEVGYGYGTGKAIMVYRTDFRLFEGADKVNLMLTESANVVITAPKLSEIELAERIDNKIRYFLEASKSKPPKPQRPTPGTDPFPRPEPGYDPLPRITERELCAGLDDVIAGRPHIQPAGEIKLYGHMDK